MISVVIPLFNKVNSIESTLESVMAQTCRDFEVVVVDDGSTDDSYDVVERLRLSDAERNKKIRLLHKENGGVSSARNAGIMAAQGEYVAFLDADDLWASTYLEELINLIADFPGAGIYGMGSNAILKSEQFAEDEKNGFRGWVSNPWDKNFGFWTGSSSSSSRANLIAVGLFDERMAYGEDLDMWYRLLLFGGGVYCSKCLAFYVQDAENRAMNKVIPFEKHLPFYIEKYTEFRKNNLEFRKYFDEQCLYRLFPYTCIRKYRKDLKRVLSQIDFSLQKPSMRLRFMFPRLYKLYMKKHHRI